MNTFHIKLAILTLVIERKKIKTITLVNYLGLERRTAQRHISILVQDGYLVLSQKHENEHVYEATELTKQIINPLATHKKLSFVK